LDLLRARRARSGWALQTPQELEPSDSQSKETAMVARFASHLVPSHGLSRPVGQSKHLHDHDKLTGDPLQGVSDIALVREMRQVSKTLFRQRTCAMACQGKGMHQK